MKETDPGVFASVLTESVQKSIDKNSYGDPVTVTVKVEKNHSRTYELSEAERSQLEPAMWPQEKLNCNRITEYGKCGLPGGKSWQCLYLSMHDKLPVAGSMYRHAFGRSCQ